ncbi:Pnap_2097 family protein [Rhizobium tumorigenes]|uniref:Pnap_2097 family protein n=1 Tax=Rhizobium tumorigenes TaxID=2041385 RepID=UPI00241EA1CD|nr:Pnap_2097 family protein [Rhizobium tumorigenes]WFS00313.1 DNA gyrase [Rhizobium tumorigenes]
MNIALRPPGFRDPSPRDLVDRALDPHLLVGMPHMTPHSLSETWLMKELGHRHWLMLARELDMENADFRTAEGNEAYAAICATSLNAEGFGDVKANDILTIRSKLSAVSMTQTSTTHELSVKGRYIGGAELISTFVHRRTQGCNRSIARVAVSIPRPEIYKPSQLSKTASDLRNRRLDRHWGLPVIPSKPLPALSFRPSASEEFNGAGLFYFAEFQAMAERALETFIPDKPPTTHREVFFLGNIETNETVFFDLLSCDAQTKTFHGQLRRQTGKVIATMFMRCDAAPRTRNGPRSL